MKKFIGGYPKSPRKKEKFAVECLECGRNFKTSSMIPSCPKCGGSDIELAD